VIVTLARPLRLRLARGSRNLPAGLQDLPGPVAERLVRDGLAALPEWEYFEVAGYRLETAESLRRRGVLGPLLPDGPALAALRSSGWPSRGLGKGTCGEPTAAPRPRPRS